MTPCNKLTACSDCKFSSPSLAYPMILCNLMGGFMAPQFKCKWFDRRKSA